MVALIKGLKHYNIEKYVEIIKVIAIMACHSHVAPNKFVILNFGSAGFFFDPNKNHFVKRNVSQAGRDMNN